MHHNSVAPPAYAKWEPVEEPQLSRWNPKTWSKWTIIAIVAAVIIIIAAIVIGAVEGTKSNKYPDYSKLTYSLTDTYSGEDFFDNFDYYSGADPSDGFVW